MKKYSIGLFVLVFGLMFSMNVAKAATIFSDDFGANGLGTDTDEISWGSWSNGGNSGDDAEIRVSSSGNDSVSPDGGRHAVILGEGGYICITVTTTGYENVKLAYHWRGDNDAESSDDGLVEYKTTDSSCSSGSFTNLKTHDLSLYGAWNTETAFDLPNSLDNTTFKLKFRVDSSSNDEHFRIDGISVTGDSIVVPGSLTIYKNVLNPEGSEVSDNQSFSVTLNGANTQYVSENSSYVYTNLVPGTYAVGENVNADYDFMSFSVDTDPELSGAQVTVVAGANTNLTITNKQKQGTVTVNKVVTNPNGGTAVAGDFSFSVNGGSPIQFIQDLGNSLMGSNTFNWNPGAVSITESVGQYAISYSGCNFVLASNGNNTCTITNSDIPEGQGAITVVKNVVNDNGGTKTVSDFNLYIGEMMVTSGQSNFLEPGEYTISEGDLPAGYTQTSIVCSNGETETSGTVNLTAQSAWTCTITNDDQPAHLTIAKNTVNDALNGSMDGEFTFNLSGQETPIVLSTVEGMSSTTIDVNAGNYTLIEIVPEDWKLTGISCESEGDEVSDGVSLSLSNGENLTCTFTNTRKMGSVKITKVIELGDGEKTVSDFMIHMSLNSEEVPESPKPGSEEGTVYGPFVTGTYKIFENNVIENGVGYAAHYDGDCDPTGMVNVVDGETLECTVTNTRFVHSGGGSGGGEVLGAQIENTTTENSTTNTTTENPKEEPKTGTGEVLGDSTESCTAYLAGHLFFGKKNNTEEVKKLQTFLNEHMGLNLVVDGFYGVSTRDAVKAFQEKYPAEVLAPWGITVGTGNVYKTTLRWINMTKCPSLALPMPELR